MTRPPTFTWLATVEMQDSTNTSTAGHVGPTVKVPNRVAMVVAPFLVAAGLVGGPSTATTIPVEARESWDTRDRPTAPLRNNVPVAVTATEPVHSADLSVAVRGLRDVSGLTWDQLAKLFGVSRRSVHHWANGSRMTGAHAQLLSELTRLVRDLRASGPDETRSRLLEPGPDGYSLFDRIRARQATSESDTSNAEHPSASS
jgi:transcriptional regulator with XRE-family HTH domain